MTHTRPSARPWNLAMPLSALLIAALLFACTRDPQHPASETAPVSDRSARTIVWTSCVRLVGLSNSQLDTWRSRGVNGFVCGGPSLRGLGGDQDFTADPNATLEGPQYDLQRAIRHSKIVPRAAARGIDVWLGFRLLNYYNTRTPLADWFDNAGWSKRVLPKVVDLAGAAHALGFAGIGIDGELYPQSGGRTTATWDWNYPGNRHSEAAVRAKVRQRGAQLMRAILQGYPRVSIIDYYDSHFPQSWNELVQREINHADHAYASFVQINLWDGLTSVPGYGPIWFLDATFYKTWHISGASWDTALSYNVNSVLAYLSRHLSNWSYAYARVQVSPFAWIDGDVKNEGSFTAPRSPEYVAEQLAAFRRWSMGGLFGVFAYGKIAGGFDYGPYSDGMRAASNSASNNQPPQLVVNDVRHSDHGITITGTATDDTAIRAVTWQAGGAHGAAPMRWTVTGGDYLTRYEWRMDWTATVPDTTGSITVTARDISGATATVAAS
jgi:hypothetical protein